MEKSMFWHLSWPKPTQRFSPVFRLGDRCHFAKVLTASWISKPWRLLRQAPVTTGWQRLCDCQTLKHLNLDWEVEVSKFSTSFPISLEVKDLFLFWAETLESWTRSWHCRQRSGQCKSTLILEGAATIRCAVDLESRVSWFYLYCPDAEFLYFVWEDHPPNTRTFVDFGPCTVALTSKITTYL